MSVRIHGKTSCSFQPISGLYSMWNVLYTFCWLQKWYKKKMTLSTYIFLLFSSVDVSDKFNHPNIRTRPINQYNNNNNTENLIKIIYTLPSHHLDKWTQFLSRCLRLARFLFTCLQTQFKWGVKFWILSHNNTIETTKKYCIDSPRNLSLIKYHKCFRRINTSTPINCPSFLLFFFLAYYRKYKWHNNKSLSIMVFFIDWDIIWTQYTVKCYRRKRLFHSLMAISLSAIESRYCFNNLEKIPTMRCNITKKINYRFFICTFCLLDKYVHKTARKIYTELQRSKHKHVNIK